MKRISQLTGAFAAVLSLACATVAEAVPTLCAAPSREGDATLGSASVNTYFPATTSVAIGATSIAVGAADTRGATTPIAVGDLLLVIQVQGASINSSNSTSYGGSGGGRGYTALNNAGNYEYVRATSAVSASGGTVGVTPLANGYTNGNPTTTSGTARSRFQVIRVPQYRNASVTGTVAPPRWNGATGGVVAFDVAAELAFAGGSVNADGAGFRGGGGRSSTAGSGAATDYASNQSTNGAHGSKGEGIGGTPLRVVDNGLLTLLTSAEIAGALSGARGAPGNAGGGGTDGNPASNDQNAGGGGGSNGGAGGQGGYAWCSGYNTANACSQSGGLGGVALPNVGKGDIFMGGGGGAGSMNDNTGDASGSPGGGIVMIRAGTVSGSGSISANGATIANSRTTNDATGGGGGGGSIQLFAISLTGSVSANARGGAGTSNTGGGASHGPGGGGGGGVIVSNVTLSTNVAGGAAGTTASSAAYGANYGAAAGASGVVDTAYPSTSPVGRLYSGAECTPVVTKEFDQSTIPTSGSARLTVTLSNPNPTLALSAAQVSDALPTNVLVAGTPSQATTCTSGTVAATAGQGTVSISGAAVAAAASCTFSANVTSSTNGTYVNVIPAGGLAGTLGGATVRNAEDATASLTVTPGLTISKTSRTRYDPYNGLTNPKSIPGSLVQYSLTVTNPSNLPVTADSVVMSDAIPANTALVVSPLYTQQGLPGARGPFQYLDGTRADGSTGTASGLSFTFTSLSDTADSPSFSSDGTTFDYSPTATAIYTDTSVKTLRLRMFGTMAPNSVFTVNFLVRVN